MPNGLFRDKWRRTFTITMAGVLIGARALTWATAMAMAASLWGRYLPVNLCGAKKILRLLSGVTMIRISVASKRSPGITSMRATARLATSMTFLSRMPIGAFIISSSIRGTGGQGGRSLSLHDRYEKSLGRIGW